MELILDDLRLLDQDIHHHVYLLSDLVCLFLEELQHIVPSDELILKRANNEREESGEDLPLGF